MVDVARELINFRMAEVEIYKVRAFGSAESFDEIVRRCGFADEDEFWLVALSEPMDCDSFVLFLRNCLLPPNYAQTPTDVRSWSEELKRIEDFLHQSFEVAFDKENQSWFFRAPDGELHLHPQAAIEWLWSKPFRRDLVPESLRRFMGYETNSGVATAPDAQDRKQKRRPDSKLSDVAQALRDLFPKGKPDSADRAYMQREVQNKIGRDVSLPTIDRARKVVWPD